MKYSLENGKIENAKTKNISNTESLLSSSLADFMKNIMNHLGPCFKAFSSSMLGGKSIDYIKDKIINYDDYDGIEKHFEIGPKCHREILPAKVIKKDGEFIAYDEDGNRIKGEDGVFITDSLGGIPTNNIYMFKDDNLILFKENSTIPVYTEENISKKYNILKGSL